MPTNAQQFLDELASIRADLTEQGARVTLMASAAFDAVYRRDTSNAEAILAQDDEVDRADVEIERKCVDLLVRTANDACDVGAGPIRSLLTAVKVNNELERIADAATEVSERVIRLGERTTPFPKTLLVMTNSVLGILRDTVRAFADTDPVMARAVLASEGAVLQFKELITRDAQERVAEGRMSVAVAFDLNSIAARAVTMADYCTNVAEQVIYESTGQIVRHTSGEWIELP